MLTHAGANGNAGAHEGHQGDDAEGDGHALAEDHGVEAGCVCVSSLQKGRRRMQCQQC